MFNVDWILAHASELPDPARLRRPGLITRARAGSPISVPWSFPPDMRKQIGTFPNDTSGVNYESAALPAELGAPGTSEWASAVAVFDNPVIAIPLGEDRLRLGKAFRAADGSFRVMTVELIRPEPERGRPSTATIGAATIIDAAADEIADLAREHFELLYLNADPNVRDRLLSEDRSNEQMLLYVDDDPDRALDARAAAATFGFGVHQLRPNIARDSPRLKDEIGRLGPLIAGAVLLEAADDGSLAWVADQIRAEVGAALPVERIGALSAADLRLLIRVVLSEAPTAAAPSVLELPTCDRCQPHVANVIKESNLAITTVAAQEGEICVCERTAAGKLSLRIRIAARLADEDGILIIGYQENFKTAVDGISAVFVRHLRSAGDPKAVAEKVTLAVVAPGSVMGHAESKRYLDALDAAGARVVSADGSQLSDVIQELMKQALIKRPELELPN